MGDATEVLTAIFESLSMVGGEGQRLFRKLFEWQVGFSSSLAAAARAG